MDKKIIPDKVNYILKRLSSNGFSAYIVGGAVRNLIMGVMPIDWDISTSATPDEVIKLFEHTIPTGLKHGTVTVIIDKDKFEITTFRLDGEYSDSRRPDNVIYTQSLSKDLSRRDFTINAMAMDVEGNIVDIFNGNDDIIKKEIRCVGNAYDRFSEDPLRMMRAIRFASVYGFTIEKNTFASIVTNSSLIELVSKERIRDELCKILTSKNPIKGINMLFYSGILKIILPEIADMYGFNQDNPRHDSDLYEHTMRVVAMTPDSLVCRLAGLFHDVAKIKTMSYDEKGIAHFYGHQKIGAEMTRDIMRRLKFDNNTIDRVANIVYDHMGKSDKKTDRAIKRFINRVGKDNIYECFDVMTADIYAHKPPFDMQSMYELVKRTKEIIKENHPMSLKDLKINGNDLLDMGYKGKEIGVLLEKCLDYVLEDTSRNHRNVLINFILWEV